MTLVTINTQSTMPMQYMTPHPNFILSIENYSKRRKQQLRRPLSVRNLDDYYKDTRMCKAGTPYSLFHSPNYQKTKNQHT